MAGREKAAMTAALEISTTKVAETKDLNKVLDYFRYKVGTSLDCMCDTGVLRNCITWYVRDLEKLGLPQAIYVAKDRRTHFRAKHYSADPAMWIRKHDAQLSLFKEED